MNLNQSILIPDTPCPWDFDAYVGREVEFTPVGMRTRPRAEVAGTIVRLGAQRFSHCACSLERRADFMTTGLRIYQEMDEFVEFAGLTCSSSEAVAWTCEAVFDALSELVVDDNGRAVVVCHAPSDYNNHTGVGGDRTAHSTGCHINLLSPRVVTHEEVVKLACFMSPLNVVFGPGGISWAANRPRFTCDPRADHVQLVHGRRAHGDTRKPFVFQRDEAFATPPQERIQISGLGAPRSPVSTWLQAELAQQTFRAILAGKEPPWRVAAPLDVLRASPNKLVRLETPSNERISKVSLAIKLIDWLADFSESHTADTARVALTQKLANEAALASVSDTTPPVFPTDIGIKRVLFDRICQMHEVGNLSELRGNNPRVKHVLDKILLADIFFSTPSRRYSTYEMACRDGLFVRPTFERPTCGPHTSLPDGVAKRDRVRSMLIARSAPRIVFANWNMVVMTNGVQYHLPDPWSDIK